MIPRFVSQKVVIVSARTCALDTSRQRANPPACAHYFLILQEEPETFDAVALQEEEAAAKAEAEAER